MLSIYPSDLIKDLPLSVAVDYIMHSIEKEKDQAAWELWCGMYPYMAMEWLKPIKFNELKDKLFQKQYKHTQKTSEEIMNEMLAVVARHEGR